MDINKKKQEILNSIYKSKDGASWNETNERLNELIELCNQSARAASSIEATQPFTIHAVSGCKFAESDLFAAYLTGQEDVRNRNDGGQGRTFTAWLNDNYINNR
jgi:hypothetical protein